MLYLEVGIDPQKLEEYGFERADKLKARGIRIDFSNESYIKFAEDEDEPGTPYYADGDVPMCQLSFLPCQDGRMRMYNDCAPDCTYHVSSFEIEVLEKTLFDLLSAGMLVWEAM